MVWFLGLLVLVYPLSTQAAPSAAPLAKTVIQSSECRVACRWAGYDTGTYQEESCWCADRKSYEIMTGTKRLSTPRRAGLHTPAPAPTYHFTFP
jgi:hypothetical protein